MKTRSLFAAALVTLAACGSSDATDGGSPAAVVAAGGQGGTAPSGGSSGATTGGSAGSTSQGGAAQGGSSGGGTAGGAGGSSASGGSKAGGSGGTSAGGSSTGGTSSGGTSSGGTSSGGASAGGTSTGGTSTGGATAATCTDSYAIPPTNLPGWSPALSQSGTMTPTWDPNHSHDDGRGPLGFCPADVAPGDHYLALVSARFETDEMPPDQICVVDYTAPDPTFAQYGMCWSGGNHNIYVEVRDASGQRVVAGFEAFYGSSVDSVSDQGKPANEFPMNYAIYADGTYGARATYMDPTYGALKSDAVTNMRMPIHHHVSYLLTFQVATK